MLRSLAAALLAGLLLQDASDAGAEKSRLHEALAASAEAAGEQLIKLKAWDEARAFLELIRAKSDAGAEALDKLIAKTEKQTSGLKWDAKSSDLIKSFGTEQAKPFFTFARAWKDKDAEASRWTEAEAEILEDLLDYVKAYARLTQIRAHYELPKTRFDWKLSVPAIWHAKYLQHNPNDPREVEGKEGFTIEGRDSAKHSVASRAESLTDLIEDLVHAPFHRLYVLQPRLNRTGFGQDQHAIQTGVIDVQSGLTRGNHASEIILSIPRDGSTEVPTAGYDDSTRIIEGKSMRELGYPLSLVFFNSKAQITKVRARLTESMKSIDIHLSTPETPALPSSYPTNRHMILMIPKTPLKPQTHYSVSVDFSSDNIPQTIVWSFKTGR